MTKFLLTIYLKSGTFNLHADNENAARLAFALLLESSQVERATLHQVDKRDVLGALLFDSREVPS